MNNRYIFRGKRKDNKKWIEGYYVCNGEHCYIFSGKLGIINKNFNWVRYEVIPETVGQCTGLKDKNGKWIFAGDVVVSTSDRRLSDRPRLITIDFERGCNYCAAKRKPVVIGNIHDNPELLEADRWKKEVTKMKEEIE